MRHFAVVVAMFAGVANAQVSAMLNGSASRGVGLLPSSVAFVDDPGALTFNPAGLPRMSALEALYAHERNASLDQLSDGLLFGAAMSGVGAGLGLQWVRSPGANSRKTTYGFGVGPEYLSAGVALNVFAGGPAEGLVSVDVGLMSRPCRGFSMGLTVRQLDAPSNANVTLSRVYSVGVGFRPFTDRISLGVDYAFSEALGPINGRLSYTLKAVPVKGLTLFAAAVHGFSAVAPFVFQGGLSIDAPNVGLGYAFAGEPNAPNGMQHVFQARASLDEFPALSLGEKKIAVISLAGVGSGRAGVSVASILGLSEIDRYLRFTRFLEAAARDSRLQGVVLKIENTNLGLGRAWELRQAIERFRASGKTVISLILSANDTDYLVASAADHVFAVPEAMLIIDGLQASSLFLGGTMEKAGVSWDVVRVGAFKNAPDQLTRTDMSPEQKEAVEALLKTNLAALEKAGAGRNLKPDAWQAAVDQAIPGVQKAKALGLIDEVITPAALDEKLKTLLPDAHVDLAYHPPLDSFGRWGERPKIALIPVLGSITGGGDDLDPLSGDRSSGSETFIRALNAAAADRTVKAIVLRIDSPGGDGLASDLMYRAVLKAKKKKPVIVSMGDVAASGGYYVAMGADQIFAAPTTITGSIGVFFLKPSFKELAGKLGAHQQTINKAARVGMLNMFEPWTTEQKSAAQAWVDSFYDTFITEVASSRKKPKADIDAIARGRVWSGTDALARGLVDTDGSLIDAINEARKRAGLDDVADTQLTFIHSGPRVLNSILAETRLAEVLQEIEVRSPTLPRVLGAAASELSFPLRVAPGLQARTEFDLRVE